MTSNSRLHFLDGRTILKGVMISLFAVFGPIGLAAGFVVRPFIKPRSYCPNYRCRKISPEEVDICPYCGFNKDVFGNGSEVNEEKRAPACLNDLLVETHQVEKNQTSFGLRCSCGCKYAHVLGHYGNSERQDGLFYGPLALKCVECEKVTEIFDESIHGYDAEQGSIRELQRTRDDRVHYRSSDDLPIEMEATFKYSHGYVFSEIAGAQGHPEDYFDWFTLTGKPRGRKEIFVIVDVECA